ncbi:hypothetical protein GGC65_002427 [Sphingopyxis sp. OAS728]|nr:hypothetical protein [Sphingopyxis sp. OAS728]
MHSASCARGSVMSRPSASRCSVPIWILNLSSYRCDGACHPVRLTRAEPAGGPAVDAAPGGAAEMLAPCVGS